VAGAVLAPAESLLLGALSQSTGSVAIDAAVGAAVGYALAPKDAKARYAVGAALATGLFGALGLVGTLGTIWAIERDKPARKRRR
jgi:predicted cation transporter